MKFIVTKKNSYKVPLFGTIYTCHLKGVLGTNKFVLLGLKRINSDCVNVLELSHDKINDVFSVRSTNKFLLADFLLDDEALEITVRSKEGKLYPIED